MKKFTFSINGNPYDVDIENVDTHTAEVNVNGTTYHVEVEKSLPITKTPKLVRPDIIPSSDAASHHPKTSSPAAPKGSGTIKAPLPGTILTLHVKQGEKVNYGQRLITLEAMKMENLINSDKEGVVVEVRVNQGDNVMEGDVLLIIN